MSIPRRCLPWLLALSLIAAPSVGGVVAVEEAAGGPIYLPLVTRNYNPYAGLWTVNAPYFSAPANSDNTLNDAQWTQSAIFWLGVNGQGYPGVNYADVRLAYTNYGLHVRVTLIDYFLWYPDESQWNPSTQDLSQWDSIALFLDTNLDRAAAPQPDDYMFHLAPRIWDNPGKPNQYRRNAQGTGTTWNMSWAGNWRDSFGMVWSQDPGPNNNSTTIDYGGDALLTIPWATLGRTGPPADGARWGLGLALYDRDNSFPVVTTQPQTWPEGLLPNNPGSWGVLNFGPARFSAPSAIEEGTTQIRAASVSDNTVEDAWVGGGGSCSGGHNGEGNTNHGSDTSLFVAAQALAADFPCFSKAYLRFSLNTIPPGKKIISASLTLRHWGNANPAGAKPSWVHLFQVPNTWQESSLGWNNAPMALRNVSATWVNPRPAGVTNLIGDPYSWDASLLVAEAYTTGQPLSVALYSSDTAFDSSKYLGSSEAIDQYVLNRPLLTVVWGR